MKSVYVIMKERTSAVTMFPQRPHEIHYKLDDTKRRVNELNAKATNNNYWYERVPVGK